MSFETYADLEGRIHIANSLDTLNALYAEANQYFSLGTLSLTEPLGFFYNEKWQREFDKRQLFLGVIDSDGFSLMFNGQQLIYNGESVTYNE